MKRIVLPTVITFGLLVGGAAIVERAFVSRSTGPHYFGYLATSEAVGASYSLRSSHGKPVYRDSTSCRSAFNRDVW
jgi:hypothetical protein